MSSYSHSDLPYPSAQQSSSLGSILSARSEGVTEDPDRTEHIQLLSVEYHRRTSVPAGNSYSRRVSALDLSTTPFLLQTARYRSWRLEDLGDHALPTPLPCLLEGYSKPFNHGRTISNLSPLCIIQSYETEILLPYIRTESLCQSILIDQAGNIRRRRTPPYEKIMNLSWIPGFLSFPCNKNRVLEGLTLEGLVHKGLDQDFDNLWENTNSYFYQHTARRKLKFKVIKGFFLVLVAAFGWGLVIGGFKVVHFNFSTIDQRVCGTPVSGPYPCKISPNPDVAGIGGRIALYIQTFIPSILLTFSAKDANAATWTLVTTSTAFTLSALVSTATSQLTLYHVTLVAKMQGLPIVMLGIIEFSPPSNRGPYIFLLQRIRLLSSIAVLIWYTIKAPCFGSEPKCNAHVTSRGWFSYDYALAPTTRGTSLLYACISVLSTFLNLIVYPLVTSIAIRSLFSESDRKAWYLLPRGFHRGRPTSWADLRSSALGALINDNSKPKFIDFKTFFKSKQFNSFTKHNPPHRATARLPPADLYRQGRLQLRLQFLWANIKRALSYPKTWRFAIACGIFGVLVRNIEVTISANDVDAGEDMWTYGQVMTVMLTVVPVVQLLQFFGLVPSPGEEKMGKSRKKKRL